MSAAPGHVTVPTSLPSACGGEPHADGSPRTDRLLPGSPEWLRVVSSSKVAAILGLSPYESPRSLWMKMRGELPSEPQTSAQARGKHLEAGLLDWYFADFPGLIRAGGETTVRRPDLPWAICSPDDIATDPRTGESFPVEAKTDGRGVFGESGTDQVPLHYVVQGMWTCHVGGWDRIVYTVLGPWLDRSEFVLRYDPTLAQEIEDRCRAFYESLTDDRAAPALDGTVATYEALRAVSVVGDGDWECPPSIARELCEAREGEEAAKRRHLLARSTVLDAMGDAKRVTCAGQVLGQKQATKSGRPALYPPRKAVDLDALPTTDTTEESAA